MFVATLGIREECPREIGDSGIEGAVLCIGTTEVLGDAARSDIAGIGVRCVGPDGDELRGK